MGQGFILFLEIDIVYVEKKRHFLFFNIDVF